MVFSKIRKQVQGSDRKITPFLSNFSSWLRDCVVTCVWVCVCVCISVWVCGGLCQSVFLCERLYMYVWVCVGVCVCVYFNLCLLLSDLSHMGTELQDQPGKLWWALWSGKPNTSPQHASLLPDSRWRPKDPKAHVPSLRQQEAAVGWSFGGWDCVSQGRLCYAVVTN